ncbi:MAG: hypothetical protein IKZ52_10610 [Bacteroidales bacterium]|nr:hypothetical protein [Bacteroidales bacterium]
MHDRARDQPAAKRHKHSAEASTIPNDACIVRNIHHFSQIHHHSLTIKS